MVVWKRWKILPQGVSRQIYEEIVSFCKGRDRGPHIRGAGTVGRNVEVAEKAFPKTIPEYS